MGVHFSCMKIKNLLLFIIIKPYYYVYSLHLQLNNVKDFLVSFLVYLNINVFLH